MFVLKMINLKKQKPLNRFLWLDFKKPIGPKGKAPWITDDDGKDYSDSQLIIEHLTK
jgi:hypothetical protein